MGKILVTGGSGFIGGHTVQELESRGHDVIIMDVKPPNFITNAEFYKHDIIKPLSIYRNFDVIIHCAGMLGTSVLFNNIIKAEQVNVIGSLNIFKFAAKYCIPIIHTNLLGDWLNPYMQTKKQAERYGWMFAKEYGLRYTSVVPTDVYGPRQSMTQDKAVVVFINKALQGKTLPIYGDGSSWVNYIYVKDVAKLLVNIVEKNEHGQVLYLSHPDNDMTVTAFAKLIIKIVNSKSILDFVEMRKGQPGNIEKIEHDRNKTWRYINKDDLVSLSYGLTRTIEWYKNLL